MTIGVSADLTAAKHGFAREELDFCFHEKAGGALVGFDADPEVSALTFGKGVHRERNVGEAIRIVEPNDSDHDDTVIFVEHDWNPMRDLQAMDRAHRLAYAAGYPELADSVFVEDTVVVRYRTRDGRSGIDVVAIGDPDVPRVDYFTFRKLLRVIRARIAACSSRWLAQCRSSARPTTPWSSFR